MNLTIIINGRAIFSKKGRDKDVNSSSTQNVHTGFYMGRRKIQSPQPTETDGL
jgi:hypothetical protein